MPEDIINCIEELGINWRKEHLNNKITSIDLPIKHDFDSAKNLIKKIIEENKSTKCYILVKYVIKENRTRESMYYFSKLFFNEFVKEKIYVQNFVEEIWKSCDEYLIKNIINKIKEYTKYDKIIISKDDFNKLLNFLYFYNEKIFDEEKLLPDMNNNFHTLNELMYEDNVNQKIKSLVISNIDSKLNNKLLNHEIKIDNLKINYFKNDDLIEMIIKYMKNKTEEKNYKENMFYISDCIFNFLPKEKSNNQNEQNNKFFNEYKDIREIYKIIFNNKIKNEELETKYDSLWSIIGTFFLKELQEMLKDLEIKEVEKEGKKEIFECIKIKNKITGINYTLAKNVYIDILNTYQTNFDFKKYKLLPNYYGKFLYSQELKDYADIPDDILDEIYGSFKINLRNGAIMEGLKIENVSKEKIMNLGILIGKLFNEEKKKDNFNYEKYYSLCKCIIKYIPKENKTEHQLKLYNLTKIFDENIGKYKEIPSNEILYYDINEGIIQFINESIQNCYCIETLNNICHGHGYKLIDNNKNILKPDKYAIIPKRQILLN